MTAVVASAIVQRKPRAPLLRIVAADLHRYAAGASAADFFRCFCSTPGFRYTVLMRIAAALRARGTLWRPAHYLCRFMLRRCGVRHGISIPYNTNVGAGLYIGHCGGIVVSGDAVIGRDCNINHGVTIGVKYGGRNPGVPVIGNRVYLGPGCVVIGAVRLGNGVAIGANAVVVDTVPDAGVVAGVPARLISLRGSADYVANPSGAHDRPLAVLCAGRTPAVPATRKARRRSRPSARKPSV